MCIRDSNGSIRRPDLILFNDSETRVIDFKFTDTKEKEHVEQVQAYMRLLQEMEFGGITGYLVLGFDAEVLDVVLSGI